MKLRHIILTTITAGLLLSTATAVLTPSDAGAQELLGFPSWDRGLECDNGCPVPSNAQELQGYIWTIALNISETVIRAVGVISVFFIIFGGMRYMMSGGSPEAAAQGRKFITNAVIGLIIAIVAAPVMRFVWGLIVGGTGSGAAGGIPGNDAGAVLSAALNQLIYPIAGSLAVIGIVWSGFLYMTASGDPGKVTKAKNSLLYSVIGLIIVIFAFGITTFVNDQFS